MALDKTSELIAHFIGIFEISTDTARLRAELDKFLHSPNQDLLGPGLGSVVINFNAPYALAGYDPSLSTFWFPGFSPDVSTHSIGSGAVIQQLKQPHAPHSNDMSAPVAAPNFGGGSTFIHQPFYPSSVGIVSFQYNVLQDNDILSPSGTINFIKPAVFDEILSNLVALQTQSALPSVYLPQDVLADAPAFFQTTLESFAELPEGDGFFTATGEDVQGITVDGVNGAALPQLSDLLPEIMRPDDVDADEQTQLTEIDPAGSAEAIADFFEVEDGHSVVPGANFVTNQAIVATATIDADVIVVMGDVTALTLVSQVNVLQDWDSGLAGQDLLSTAINAVSVSAISSAPPAEEDSTDVPIMPSNWNVTRIDGDVMTLNWLVQQNFITDHDLASVTYSGEDTLINLGGNITLNQTTLLEWGLTYDLIIVGGQMIDMNLIYQTNILLDNDHVTYSDDFPVGASTSDNLLLNTALIQTTGVDTYIEMTDAFADVAASVADGSNVFPATLSDDALLTGSETLNVLYIDGDLINVNAVSQTNTVGDADQVHLALETLLDRDAEPDGPVTVTTGSNALVNVASILEVGLDSTILVGGDTYDDALLYQANLLDIEAEPVGVSQSPLAPAAVAFLAENMMEEPIGLGGDIIAPSNVDETSSDVMQSMLA